MSATGRTKVGVRWDVSGLEKQMDFFGKANGNSVMTITDGGVITPNPSYGVDYKVDGNSGDTLANGADGLSWGNAFSTFAEAVTASNLTIVTSPHETGAGFAARNTIVLKGDTLAEDITILPNKCDVIGVGSHDSNPMATLEGDHTIDAGAYIGTRFFNMRFLHKNAAGDIFTVPTTTGGLAFIGCVFDAHQATKAGGALVITASLAFKVIGCRFIGAYSDAVIELGAGAMADMLIQGNYIEGADKGIEVNASYTSGQWKSWIIGNYFHTTLACIDENSDVIPLIDNRGVTLAAKGASLAGAVDGNANLSMGNRFSTSDATNVLWPAEGAI